MAQSTMRQQEMFELKNRHFREHSSAFEHYTDEPTRFDCGMCGTPGFGPRRSCLSCGMTYHPFCGTCTPTLPCFLHPGQHHHGMSYAILFSGSAQCTICYGQIVGSYYRCDQRADWMVHPVCYFLRQRVGNVTRSGVRQINHFSHPGHPLMEIYQWAAYSCNACGTMGFGLRYRCERCNFDLHHQCATCPAEQPCLLHKRHNMALATITSGSTPCVVCGELIARSDRVVGLHYCCGEYNVRVHPLCHQLQQLYSITATATFTSGANAGNSRGAGGSGRIRKRDILFKLIRSAFLHSIGVPDIVGVVDALDGISMLWESACTIFGDN